MDLKGLLSRLDATASAHGPQGFLRRTFVGCFELSIVSQAMICIGHVQGPEIRTGFLKNPDQPVKLTQGKEITITTNYEHKGDDSMISCRSGSFPAGFVLTAHPQRLP